MIKRLLWSVIFMSISVYLWISAYNIVDPSAYSALHVGQRYSNNKITQEMLNRTENNLLLSGEEEHPGPYLAWQQEDMQRITEENTGKNDGTTDVMIISGTASLLWDSSKFSIGTAPILGDEYSCAVSSNLAYKLWGSEQIISKKILWNDRELEVCGVLRDDKNPILILQNPQSNDKQEFGGLEIIPLKNAEFTEGISSSDRLADFMMTTGLPKGDLTISYNENTKIIRMLTVLPSVLLIIIMMWRAKRVGISEKKAIIRIIPMICAVIFSLILIMLFRKILFWPEEYLPTMWSNFDFWSSKFTETIGYFFKSISLPSYLPDIEFMSRQIKAIASIIACMFLVFPASSIKDFRVSDYIILSIIGLLVAFIITILLKSTSVYFIWLSWPVFFASMIVNSQFVAKSRGDGNIGNN